MSLDISSETLLVLIVIPVFVGIATSGLIFVGKRIIENSLEPWLWSKFSANYEITGVWKSIFPAEHDPNITIIEHITVRQNGKNIRAITDYVEVDKDSERFIRRKRFHLRGTFIEPILTITYDSSDSRTRSRGTLCMLSTNDYLLEGKYAFFDPDLIDLALYGFQGGRSSNALPDAKASGCKSKGH